MNKVLRRYKERMKTEKVSRGYKSRGRNKKDSSFKSFLLVSCYIIEKIKDIVQPQIVRYIIKYKFTIRV